MKDKLTVSFENAKFMLVICSAFCNYLASKADKVGIQKKLSIKGYLIFKYPLIIYYLPIFSMLFHMLSFFPVLPNPIFEEYVANKYYLLLRNV